MVKFWTSDYTYDYGFSTVSLAYFLRYPNPYARHVASTDTIERHFDPETQRLTTVRLHLKRSRMPPAVVKLLPSSYMSNATPTAARRASSSRRAWWMCGRGGWRARAGIWTGTTC